MTPSSSTASTILVVDDDKEIVSLVRSYLEQANYHVLAAYDGQLALQIMRRDRPDLVVLDLMLPNRDGWDITRMVRGDPKLKHIPIIMLTARVEDADKIVGLELGADDYITKPFNPREVVARVRTVLRRINQRDDAPREETMLYCGELTLNTATRTVMQGKVPITLTPTEFKLLHLFIAHPNFVFTRYELAEKIFGYNYETSDRTLDNHIRNLRKKIEPDPANPVYIHTIYGVGYRLVEV